MTRTATFTGDGFYCKLLVAFCVLRNRQVQTGGIPGTETARDLIGENGELPQAVCQELLLHEPKGALATFPTSGSSRAERSGQQFLDLVYFLLTPVNFLSRFGSATYYNDFDL